MLRTLALSGLVLWAASCLADGASAAPAGPRNPYASFAAVNSSSHHWEETHHGNRWRSANVGPALRTTHR